MRRRIANYWTVSRPPAGTFEFAAIESVVRFDNVAPLPRCRTKRSNKKSQCTRLPPPHDRPADSWCVCVYVACRVARVRATGRLRLSRAPSRSPLSLSLAPISLPPPPPVRPTHGVRVKFCIAYKSEAEQSTTQRHSSQTQSVRLRPQSDRFV